MSSTETILAIIGTVLGSTGFFTFVQYLISRKDRKHDRFDELNRKIDGVKSDISDMQKNVNDSIDRLNDKIDRNQAIEARIRILRASDEMRQHVHHSYEYFRQLHHDITDYENYCAIHPDFKNNEAVNAIEYSNRVYQECLDANNFLV